MAVQPVGTSCNRDDADCIAALVENYVSEGAGKNILICWEHDNSTGIVQVSGCSRLPDNSSNIVWPDPQLYSTIVAITPEDCLGLESRRNSRTIDIPEIRDIS